MRIMKSHVISVLTYGSPVWSNRINYKMREKLNSFYYHTLRVLVRDFNFKLNRLGLLRTALMEDINVILTKRISMFLFKIIHCLAPTNIAGFLISKSYENERTLGKLKFFDSSSCRLSRASLSNSAKEVAEKWRFDWLFLEPDVFKGKLDAQFILKL